MTTIRVESDRPYDVIIGENLLSNVAKNLKKLGNFKKIAIITDDIVDKFYSEKLAASLTEYTTVKFVFKNGEESKNIDVYSQILEFLAENQLTRSDLVIALGGGVVGDIAGFAAASFLRGVPFVQIPTTLLAMVDSSVGGKTAVNLKAGKNLCGAFYQPILVLCDYTLLNTLPDKIFVDGCAEVIKYAILGDSALAEHLREYGKNFDRADVIARCVRMKADIVKQDEFDKGQRMLLNLGHTLGHSVEALSGYNVSHGSAVAIGMAIIARASAAKGICSGEVAAEITRLLEKFGLPTTTEFTAEELFRYTLSDKKRDGDYVNLILPLTVGRCEIKRTPVAELEDFIKAGSKSGVRV